MKGPDLPLPMDSTPLTRDMFGLILGNSFIFFCSDKYT